MSFDSTVRTAAASLGCNRVRSSLTMLGVIIGVAAVITMVSLGQGARAQMQADIASMGSNILYLWPGSQRTGGMRSGAGTVTTLVEDDVRAIVRECPAVRLASPTVGTGVPIVFGNQNWNTRAEGVNEHFPTIRSWTLSSGSFFSEAEVRSAARVAVLGRTVADNLFGGGDPVGQMVRVRAMPFQVIGVLSPKGQNAWGRDQDDLIVVPYTTVQKKMLGITYLHGAILSAVSPAATFTAEAEVTDLLRQRHRMGAGREDDFSLRNLTDMAEAAEQTQRTMTFLLGGIAMVSLLVGGIGIMNIMLVSVTERTREIGLRVAVGARRSQVRLQFLLESMMLSVAGGVIGILCGVGTSSFMAWKLGWPMLVSPAVVAGSVVFAGGVGMMFGYYPAHKAASLDPIEALRYE